MIDKLKNSPLNLQATSVYNFNEFSLTELLNKFFSTINQCVDSSNTSLEFLTWLKGEGLPTETIKELNNMYNDGRLTNAIDNLSGNLTGKVNNVDEKVNVYKIETNTMLGEISSQLEQITTYKPNYKIIAHRGYNCIAPENTLVSIQKCKEYGIKVAEFDVQLTSETNKFVIMHDETVDRTTNGSGTVISKTVAELKELTIDEGYNVAEYDNLKIPTLEEALACCKNNDIIPDLHISIYDESRKEELLEVVRLLRKYDMEKKCIVTWMVQSMVDYWRSISSSTILFIPPTLDYSFVDYMVTLGNCIVGVSAVDLTDGYIQYVKSKGLSLMAYTVNVVNQAQDLVNKGVDIIVTDNIVEGVL